LGEGVKDGANGWNVNTPPYYPGTDYAVDLELKPDGVHCAILHKEGSIYDSESGWNLNTPPYYPGNAWAVDMKLK
jgi:hypothetical protein